VNANDSGPPGTGASLARIRIEERGDAVSLHVRLEPTPTSPADERWFHGEGLGTRTIVLRAVEYIRGSRINIGRRARAKSSTPSKVLAPVAKTSAGRSWKVELGALAFIGVVGRYPAVGPTLALGYGLANERLWLELRASSFALNSLANAGGSAQLSHSLGTLGARWHAVAGSTFGLLGTASAGGYLLSASGRTTSTLVARTERKAVLAGTAGAGGFARLSSFADLTLVAHSELLFTSRRPGVQFGSSVLDRMARPSLLLSFGAEAYF
jgi:hypothetical protein